MIDELVQWMKLGWVLVELAGSNHVCGFIGFEISMESQHENKSGQGKPIYQVEFGLIGRSGQESPALVALIPERNKAPSAGQDRC